MASKLKIDFFQVEIPPNQATFDAMLNAIHALQGGARAYDLTSDSEAWLLQLNAYNRKLEGNFIRGRSNYLPKKGKAGQSTKRLDLDHDDDVCDESAFIFDPASHVLALQRNRYGLTRRGVEVYFSGHQALAEEIKLTPLVKKATLARLARMTNPKKLVMKLAMPQDASGHIRKGSSTNEAIKVMNKLYSPTLNIEASVGRIGGALHHAKEFAKELLALGDNDQVDIKSLQITGEIDEEPAFIDLIEDRIIAEVPVEQSERRTLPYPNRKISLRQAWAEQLSELKEYGVTS